MRCLVSLIVLAAVLRIGWPGLTVGGPGAVRWSLLAAFLAGAFFLLTGRASSADPASEGEACDDDGSGDDGSADGDGD